MGSKWDNVALILALIGSLALLIKLFEGIFLLAFPISYPLNSITIISLYASPIIAIFALFKKPEKIWKPVLAIIIFLVVFIGSFFISPVI